MLLSRVILEERKLDERVIIMIGGEIALIIAAVGFAILMIALAYVILKAAKVVEQLNTTVKEANQTLGVVTKNADHLLIEVEGLLNKSNTTLDDMNGKLLLTDPLFQAVGDLGTSVSDLNNATRNLTLKVAGKSKKAKDADLKKVTRKTVDKL